MIYGGAGQSHAVLHVGMPRAGAGQAREDGATGSWRRGDKRAGEDGRRVSLWPALALPAWESKSGTGSVRLSGEFAAGRVLDSRRVEVFAAETAFNNSG